MSTKMYTSVVGKGRFWHTFIFPIGFWCDDVTSNRTVPESALESDADSGTVLFLESDFGATTSVVSAMVGDISDSGSFWCVPGGHVPRCFTVIY